MAEGAIRAAIITKLAADSTLMGMINGIFFGIDAVGTTAPKYLVFAPQDGRNLQAFGGPFATNYVWLMQVVDIGTSAAAARVAYERAKATLTTGVLSATGYNEVYRMTEETTISYHEVGSDGRVTWYEGGLFRSVVSPTS